MTSIGSLSDLPLKDDVRRSLESVKELNVLIMGCLEMGKSALVNSLLRMKYEEKAKEGSLTENVHCYPLTMDGVTFNIYDTPGLQDESGDMAYLRKIQKECPAIHCLIYCKRMGEPIKPAEIMALKNIALTFGNSIWDNAVIALTFANFIHPPDPEADEVEYFAREKEKNVKELQKAFESFSEIFESIKDRIYPVGNAEVLQLPGMSDDWRVGFWCGCLEACRGGLRGFAATPNGDPNRVPERQSFLDFLIHNYQYVPLFQ